MNDANGIKTIMRATKNILDYDSDIRLQKLCKTLNAYRKRIILEKKIAIIKKDQGHAV
jgi:hypothetical protein